jgi:hypothetical protein
VLLASALQYTTPTPPCPPPPLLVRLFNHLGHHSRRIHNQDTRYLILRPATTRVLGSDVANVTCGTATGQGSDYSFDAEALYRGCYYRGPHDIVTSTRHRRGLSVSACEGCGWARAAHIRDHRGTHAPPNYFLSPLTPLLSLFVFARG